MNWRTSEDILTNVKGYEVGNEIKFKAGYAIYQSTSAQGPIKSGATSDWLHYTISDAALALTASLVVSSTVTSLIF